MSAAGDLGKAALEWIDAEAELRGVKLEKVVIMFALPDGKAALEGMTYGGEDPAGGLFAMLLDATREAAERAGIDFAVAPYSRN